MCIAFLVILLEFQPWLLEIKKHIQFLLVDSLEDARLILGTLVASTISLMVFSFSMVMLVLNQASANLSPRLLPGLITAKDNQIVLGFYLGTICYCLMLILNIHSGAEDYRIPSLGTFIGLCFGIVCLALFTYFIHSISQAIQVDHILDRLLTQTKDKLDKECCDQNPVTPKQWEFMLSTQQAGYLKWIEVEELVGLCREHELQMQLIEPIGYFYVGNMPYLRLSQKIDKSVEDKIHDCFVFYPEENLGDHYSFGFKQISEIAVKALSKGINDPATAIKAIDMLIMLLIHKSNCCEKSVLFDKKDSPRVFLQPTSVHMLLHINITPIREYAKEDVLVMEHLLKGLHKILKSVVDICTIEPVTEQLIAIRENCQKFILNAVDRKTINEELKLINATLSTNLIAYLPIENFNLKEKEHA